MFEKMKKHPQALLAGFIVIFIGIIMFIGDQYLIRLQAKLEHNELDHVMEMTLLQQQELDSFLSNDLERLHSYAEYFSNNLIGGAEDIEDRLDLFSDVSAEYGVVCLDEGIGCSSRYVREGSKTVQLSEALLEEYRSLTGRGVRDNYLGAISGEPRFGFYETFTFANGHKGLIQRSYERSKVAEAFDLSFYGGQGYSYMLNQSGDILRRAEYDYGDLIYTNAFEILDYYGYRQEDIDALRAAFDAKETGSVIFEGNTGKYYYSYVPLESIENWYLLSVVPLQAVSAQAETILQDTKVMIGAFVMFLALCIGVGIMIWYISRDMAAKDKKIEYQARLFDFFISYISRNTDNMYMVTDHATGVVEYVSPNMEQVIGGTLEEMIAYIRTPDSTQAVNPEHIWEHYRNVCLLSPGEAVPALSTERIAPRTGERRYFLENSYCVDIQGQCKRVSCLSDRTTEQKTRKSLAEALQIAQAANDAKSAFLSSVSHDIRTPMNAIIGFLTLMKSEADNPVMVREYTKRIDSASQHLLSLINDVLDLNKIESGGTTLSISEMSLAEVINEINTIIRPQTKAKNQTFDIVVLSLKYEHLMADKMRINQILINLLSNAVKYTQEGGTIQFSMKELPQVVESYARIQFTVSDNGMGMSEEYQKVIFDPFTREETEITHEIQGTGLGMSITKSLVELMGGTIAVESKKGVGSTFTVELELPIQKPENDPGFWINHQMTRIIVADDDEEICRSIVRIMEHTGVETDYAVDGETAVRMMQEHREAGRPYDLILLDWKMPDLGGLEIARRIRQSYPDPIPILLLTAYDWSDIEQEAMKIGVSHFMPKPFFMSTFKEAVKQVMGSQKKRETGRFDVVRGRHILVVDDIEVNRIILTKILTTLGAISDTAADGQEAVDMFNASDTGDYDLILMDVQMPLMDGYEATRAIRGSSHPMAGTVPIIAMTANAFVDDVREAIESGMDAHIPKPIQIDNLKATIRQVFDRRSGQTDGDR